MEPARRPSSRRQVMAPALPPNDVTERRARRLMEIYRRQTLLRMQLGSRSWWRSWTWEQSSFLVVVFGLGFAAPLDWTLLGIPLPGESPLAGASPGVLAASWATLWCLDAWLVGRLLDRHDPPTGRSALWRLGRRAAVGLPTFGLFLMPLLKSPPAAGPDADVEPRPSGERISPTVEAWERALRRFETSFAWIVCVFPASMVACLLLAIHLAAEGQRWPNAAVSGGLHLLALAALVAQARAAGRRAVGARRLLCAVLPLAALPPAFVGLLPALIGLSVAEGPDGRGRLVFAAFGSGTSARRLPRWTATLETLSGVRRHQRWWLRWAAPGFLGSRRGGRAALRLDSLLRLGLFAGAWQWAALGWLGAGRSPIAVGGFSVAPLPVGIALVAAAAVAATVAFAALRALAFLAGRRSRSRAVLRSFTGACLVAATAGALGHLLRAGGPEPFGVVLGLAAGTALLFAGFRFVLAIPLRHPPPPLAWILVGAATSALALLMVVDADLAAAVSGWLVWTAALSPLWSAAVLAPSLAGLLTDAGRERRGWRLVLVASALLPSGGFAVPGWRRAAAAGLVAGGEPAEARGATS